MWISSLFNICGPRDICNFPPICRRSAAKIHKHEAQLVAAPAGGDIPPHELMELQWSQYWKKAKAGIKLAVRLQPGAGREVERLYLIQRSGFRSPLHHHHHFQVSVLCSLNVTYLLPGVSQFANLALAAVVVYKLAPVRSFRKILYLRHENVCTRCLKYFNYVLRNLNTGIPRKSDIL